MAASGDWRHPPGDTREMQGIAQLGFGILVIVALLGAWKALHPRAPSPSMPGEAAIEMDRPDNPSQPDGHEGITRKASRTPGATHRSPEESAIREAALTTESSGQPCHEGLTLPPGWKVLERCFPNRAPADAIVQRLRDNNLHATSAKARGGAYVVRYQPLSEAKAREAGEAALAARQPGGGDLYELNILQDDDIDSFTWQVSMPCPDGWRDAGPFKLTAYVLAQEQDFPDEPRVEDPCGLKGDYSHPFLFGQGVRMQGSGITNDGRLIHFKGRNCFEILDCPRTALGLCARAGRTIAVDPKVITLGSEVLVEDIGYRIAEDTGGGIRGDHIDVYYGTELRLRQAWAHSREDRRVCVKPRLMAM